MTYPLFKNPKPDFAMFQRVLKGEEAPKRVHLVELGIDKEIQKALLKTTMGKPWVPCEGDFRAAYFKQHTLLFYELGYDYVPLWPEWPLHPPSKDLEAKDTALLGKGQRRWIDEHRGLISSWKEFEKFPWDKIQGSTAPMDLAIPHLPQGMKITVGTTLYEHVMERLLGYEGLFLLLHDDEELVGEVFSHWGQRVYDFYESIVEREEVGAIFHADDLGFKTSTLISPEALRKHVFPWFKKYAALAHDAGKIFLYHCCGNVYHDEVIEDLIHDVKIDGFHSFEDVILPIAEFKARYGHRVAALGGVDMDKLSRMDKGRLKTYVEGILERCMQGGRFALGAGNTVANYVPLDNYLTLLEVAKRWRP